MGATQKSAQAKMSLASSPQTLRRRAIRHSIPNCTENRNENEKSCLSAPQRRRLPRRSAIVSLVSDDDSALSSAQLSSQSSGTLLASPGIVRRPAANLSGDSASLSADVSSDSLSGFVVRDDASGYGALRRRFASVQAHAVSQSNERRESGDYEAEVVANLSGSDSVSEDSLSDEHDIDLMPSAQRTRWNRMLREQYAMLQFSSEPHGNSVRLRFRVRTPGSYTNPYEVCVDLERCCMTCSCIDFREGALECDVLCKHCCFVLYRILHVAHNGVFCHMSQRFLAPRLCRKVTHAAQVYLERQRNDRLDRARTNSAARSHERSAQSPLLSAIQRQSQQLDSRSSIQSPLRRRRVAHTYSRKKARTTPPASAVSRDMLDSGTLLQFGAGPFGVFQALDTDVEGESACGVCLEQFTPDVPVVRCGTCRQFVHQECIDAWLRQSRAERKCVFCRAVLTYALL